MDVDDVSDQPGSRRVAVMQLHARFIIKSIAALYTYRLLTSRRRNSNIRHCPSLLQSHHLNTFGRQQQQMMMVMMMVTSRTSYKHALAVCFCLFILHLAECASKKETSLLHRDRSRRFTIRVKPFTNKTITAEFNKSFVFPEKCHCAKGCEYMPPHLEWEKYVGGRYEYKNIPIENKMKRVHAVDGGRLGLELVFDVVRKEDEGKYRCVILNDFNKVINESDFELRVSGAPTSAPVFTTKIPTQLKPFTNTNVTAEINKSFEFPELCAAANGRHRPKWAKYVVDKSKYRYFPFDNTKRIHAVGNGLLGVALVFDVVKKKDEHEYKCLLLDHSHRVVEVAAVELRVSAAPTSAAVFIDKVSTQLHASTSAANVTPTSSQTSLFTTQSTISTTLPLHETVEPPSNVSTPAVQQSVETSSNSLVMPLVAVIISVVVMFVVFAAFLFYKWRRYVDGDSMWPAWTVKASVSRQSSTQSTQPCIKPDMEEENDSMMANRLSPNQNGQLAHLARMRSCHSVKYDPAWEWPREQLKFSGLLGEGYFGAVLGAETLYITPNAPTKVAVKMLKDEDNDSMRYALAMEANIMKSVGRHKNVLSLLGLCTVNGPLWLITEFAVHGNLRTHLRSKRPQKEQSPALCDHTVWPNQGQLPDRDAFGYALQIARGMEFLISHRCLHRDLAGRNVLVCDEEVLKVGDFGLARELKYCDYYRRKNKGILPVKWTAPEALFDEKLYTEYSDVWSYGILLWEIATLGGSPYPGVPVERLCELLSTSNYRLSRPCHCPQKLYEMMKRCWEGKPSERPKFSKIREDLEQIMSEIEESTNTSGNGECLESITPT
ncbi:fibroblast growth factor receptor 3-like [Corticium candelabrum]|uniref:fibroblast growth factor receptor 3-like n=1 Tax=Corticium candelabrum TaxID=121492 RepID=UPI002E25BBD7|nr:fibroblast growth factor receptor 3-like [Corticium candelabrum]